MNAIRFFDTNVFLCAYDNSIPAKRAMAREWVEQGWERLGEAAISVQVLQEMHVNLLKRSASPAIASQIVSDYLSWPVVENSLALFQAGLREQARWKLSLWDAMILAAARACGAAELISEDFSAGQDYGGVRVINPFATRTPPGSPIRAPAARRRI